MSTEVWYEAIIQFLREIRPHYNENWFHLRKSDTRTIPTLVCSILLYWTVLWRGRTVSWFDRTLPPWTSCQIRRIVGCPWPVMLGTCSPPPRVSDFRHPSGHVRDVRSVIHAGIANYRFPFKSLAGKAFPALPAHAQPAILRIWHDAHTAAFKWKRALY